MKEISKLFFMDVTSLAPIIQRLKAIVHEELEHIKEVKSQATATGAFEVAGTARDLEKKLLEFQRMIDPLPKA